MSSVRNSQKRACVHTYAKYETTYFSVIKQCHIQLLFTSDLKSHDDASILGCQSSRLVHRHTDVSKQRSLFLVLLDPQK